MIKEVNAISRELEWYNQLVGHVGIHGQRRFTEAFEKGCLVYRFGMTHLNPSLVYRFGMTGRELPNSQEGLPNSASRQFATGSFEEGDMAVRPRGQVTTAV
ncbi:hypothetical protein Taro_027323 [Colocasia esculenta]|uniref:Uncharacterized protein n=1 Tax=Colocasia esculenta TaxID=4460 RepID=A0A843V8F2_COLES|nr:hypothetical protein [Colocasia esculenta]